MSTFPVTAAEFYALRDDRTSRCTDGLANQQVSCALHIAARSASSVEGQVMFLVAANILSRWCRRVILVAPMADARPELGLGEADLGDLVLAQMMDADPFGEFRLSRARTEAADIALCIDDAQGGVAGSTIYITATGWLAGSSMTAALSLPPSPNGHGLGAIAAACLGVAQVFKLSLGLPTDRHLRHGVFDLFRLNWTDCPSHSAWPATLDFGRALMVGAGAVASSAAYCMRLAGLSGALTIVDGDVVKVVNVNRSLVFGRRSCGLPKAEALTQFLRSSSLIATPVPTWWNDFLQRQTRACFDFDVWLPLANEFGVRHSMQHNVPPLMIHASTSANWGVNHGRHLPGRDDCLIDRFPLTATVPALACATAAVPVAEATTVDAALPFCSAFAGLLVAAEMVRAQVPGYPHIPNFAALDLYGTMGSIQAWNRVARPGCICASQGPALHERYNRTSRYRGMFGFAA